MFRNKYGRYLDQQHAKATAELAEFDAQHPETAELFARLERERATREHEKVPNPDCPACEAIHLTDEDRAFLVAHGWIEPHHQD